MNNRKIKKNRGGKRMGWDRMIRLGYYINTPPLTEELLMEYLREIFIVADPDRHNDRELLMWTAAEWEEQEELGMFRSQEHLDAVVGEMNKLGIK